MYLPHTEINISAASKAVQVLDNVLFRRPALIVPGKTLVPALFLDGVRHNIQRPVITKGIYHLPDRLLHVQVGPLIAVEHRRFNRIFTRDIRFAGFPVLFQLGSVFSGAMVTLLYSLGGGLLCFVLMLLLPLLDFRIGAVFHCFPDCIHVAGLNFTEILVHIFQGAAGL